MEWLSTVWNYFNIAPECTLAFWPMLALAALGAISGAVKGKEQKDEESRDRRLAANTIRYSPWTGMRPNEIHTADMTGSILQGGAAGLSMGQELEPKGGFGSDMSKYWEMLPQDQKDKVLANRFASINKFGNGGM